MAAKKLSGEVKMGGSLSLFIFEEKEKAKRNYDTVKLKNKLDSLKGTWKEWDTLVGKETGLGWDPDKKIIQASADWWDRKIKENPNVEKFREKGLQHRQLMEYCFKDVVATGEHVWASSSGVLPDDNEEFVNIDGKEKNTEKGFEQTNPEESNVVEKIPVLQILVRSELFVP
ncbi:PREDICTED: L10-interacting MYB domain-containing protein-like [Nicotiana attenuata]|uniref:L10-interacting MYB domain-containing protein-like n=1 Tax=Nicotiana attenuata TaxID=49451 RepID=UPI00090543C4|nr:PREDICTED: L10-interacting MYB domain-containing protein-like [Nicotiana attenuata]